MMGSRREKKDNKRGQKNDAWEAQHNGQPAQGRKKVLQISERQIIAEILFLIVGAETVLGVAGLPCRRFVGTRCLYLRSRRHSFNWQRYGESVSLMLWSRIDTRSFGSSVWHRLIIVWYRTFIVCCRLLIVW
jgi:hypothetical protein